MNGAAKLACGLAAAITLFAPLARAGDVTQSLPNGVEVRAWSPWPAQARSGWAPVFVECRNGSSTARSVDLTTLRYEWRRQWRLDAQLELAPGETRQLEVLVPMSAEYSNDTSLSVTCDNQEAYLSGVAGTSALAPSAGAVVLFTQRTFEAGEIERWNAALGPQEGDPAPVASETVVSAGPVSITTIPAPTAGGPPAADIAVVRPEQAPSHTAAYSSLDLVVLDSAGAWPAPERVEALAAWLRVGGDVLVIGPDAERAAKASPQLASWVEPRFALPCDAERGSAYRAALGRLFIARDLRELEGEGAVWVREILTGRSPPAPNNANWRARDVQAQLRLEMVPQRVFAALLLLFALVIGPLNFILVSRRKQPALLLITIPAISIGVSVLLLAFGILHQGLDVKSASVSLSVLDQRSHISSSIHKRQIFAGMAPAVGLRPAAGTVVHHVALDDQSMGLMGAETILRTAQGQGWTLSGDYLPTRRLASQVLTVDRAERARLLVEFGGRFVQVTNQLGVRVEELLVRNPQGQYFELNRPLAPGAQTTLGISDEIHGRNLEFSLFAQSMSPTPPPAPAGAVPPAAYLARIAGGALLDDCGVESTEVHGLHVVLGVLDDPSEDRR